MVSFRTLNISSVIQLDSNNSTWFSNLFLLESSKKNWKLLKNCFLSEYLKKRDFWGFYVLGVHFLPFCEKRVFVRCFIYFWNLVDDWLLLKFQACTINRIWKNELCRGRLSKKYLRNQMIQRVTIILIIVVTLVFSEVMTVNSHSSSI